MDWILFSPVVATVLCAVLVAACATLLCFAASLVAVVSVVGSIWLAHAVIDKYQKSLADATALVIRHQDEDRIYGRRAIVDGIASGKVPPGVEETAPGARGAPALDLARIAKGLQDDMAAAET